jgi:hypothetical protein
MAGKDGIRVHVYGDYDDKQINKAIKGLNSLRKESGQSESTFAKLGKSAIGLGAAFGVGFAGVQTLANVFRDSIAEAQEAIKVNAATAQIIKATGSAANVTAEQVADLSQSLSEQIAVDDELIQSSANLILTFKNVANQGTGLAAVFDRTVLAAQDLSAAGFGDAESAAKMLGKALNDPERGLTALSRAGVTFSQQQKEQIRTLTEGGDVLKAQQLILAEVESQVGGVAGATATGIDKFNVYFDNLKEELGLAILPFINALISGLLPAIRGVSDMVRNSSKFFEENKTAILAATIAVSGLTAAMLLNRIGGIAFAAQYAVHTAVTASYTLAANAARIATIGLMTALRAIPFVAIATAAAAFVMVLNDGAKSQKEFREETKRNLDATNGWKDAQGNATKAAIAYGVANRFSKFAQKDLTTAISGTASAAIAAGNAMGGTLTPNTYDAGEAADSAATSYLSLFESIFNAKRIASDFANTSGTVTSALSEGVKVGSSSVWKTLAVDYGAVDKATAGATGSVKDNTASLKDNRDAFREAFGESAREAIQSTLATLRDGLDQAREKFTSFASTISSGLFGQLNIGSAVDAAAESGGSIVGSFVDQAAGVQAFGDQLQKLLKTNLSEEAFAMVASLSAEKGALLAKELLGANSETMIANFNQAVEATKTVAELVGLNSATKFYQAGVDSAQNTYDGFRDNFKKDGPGYVAMQNIMDRLAASMRRDTTVTVTTINRSVNEVLGNFGGPRALGGPVNPSKSYLVGERGPELFVPNIAGTIVPNGGSAGGAAASGSMITVNVTAGMGTDGAQVGEQIVSALRAYERRNGALPITVAS